jgi:pimeloyl-ACP methyl ester carboxylesterase
MATSVDGTRIAWRRFGEGGQAVVFVPTWNLVDDRVVGHQVAAVEPFGTVVTYAPRGAGASDRPQTGYAFHDHAADAMAVLEDTGVGSASIVTASRGLNAALLLIANQPTRFDRLAVVGPYMILEADPPAPDPDWLASLQDDWPGFITEFMHEVFTEPGSDEVISEMITIGMEAAPEVIVAQERELDWRLPASRLETTATPTLVIHGEADVPVPIELAEQIVARMPNATLRRLPGAGHRPDIRSPDLVNPILLEFLLSE